MAPLNIGRPWNDRQSGSEGKGGKGKRFGVWACRRRGNVSACRRIDGFSAKFAFKVRECSQQALIADTPYAEPPIRFSPVPPHSGAILPRDCLISDLCSLDFRISRRSARGRLELRRRSCSLAALRWAACRFPVSSINEMSRLNASWRLRY